MTRVLLLRFLPACLVALAASGCAGAAREDGALTKVEAASTDHGDDDVCAENGWYGDGECDTFCSSADTDCTPGTEPIVCAMFIEESDGVCSRAEDDACRMQDPDCQGGAVPGAPGTPDDIACAMISELPNGVCGREESDPCRFQDPDCEATSPIACAEYIEESDGVCSRPDSDPCRTQDPDCSSGPTDCAAYAEVSDGVCGRTQDDPCRSQDPDCADCSYVHEGACYGDAASACKAAGCSEKSCLILESYPMQVSCQ